MAFFDHPQAAAMSAMAWAFCKLWAWVKIWFWLPMKLVKFVHLGYGHFGLGGGVLFAEHAAQGVYLGG